MQFICASLGTILFYARPYAPQSKGKVEHWFRTMQDQWMHVIDWRNFSSLGELNASLSSYVEDEYNRRCHTAIGAAPIDKFTSHLGSIKFIATKQELDYIFVYRITRRVKNDATLSIQNSIFEVPLKMDLIRFSNIYYCYSP